MNNTLAQERFSKSIGELYVQSEDGEKHSFRLRHTNIKTNIAGNALRVEMTQTFQNYFQEFLEVVDLFPLPDEAAVDN